MEKFDAKKALKALYQPSQKEFSIIDVPEMNFLMIDGQGNPNTSERYTEAVEVIYSLAYAIKFQLKPLGLEYSVPPLEGLWWLEDMTQFSLATKDFWQWTMMIMQPPFVTKAQVDEAVDTVARKKKPAHLSEVRFEPYREGLSVQIFYLGAYVDEGPTIARMHEFAHQKGYSLAGKHHEIYLNDPRRTAPDKLKTIIRQPIQKAR